MELRESKFRQWLKDQWPAKTQHTNIESSTENGIPDCFVQVPGCEGFWLELKVNDASPYPLVRPQQRLWGIKNKQAGGRSWVVLLVEKTQEVLVFAHPIVEVSISGRYLRVHDKPVVTMPKSSLADWLEVETRLN